MQVCVINLSTKGKTTSPTLCSSGSKGGSRQIGPLADLAANWAQFAVFWQIGPLANFGANWAQFAIFWQIGPLANLAANWAQFALFWQIGF